MRRHQTSRASDETIATILAGAKPINGTGGGDVLHGTDGKDTLNGKGGDDQLFGEAGRDVLVGGAGADLLDGGAGIDVADYRGSTAISITFDKSGTSTVHVAGDADDTIRAIERINGSNAGDTFDITATHPKSIYGEGGDDTIYADPLTFDSKQITIQGGGGSDTLDLSHDSAPPGYVPENPFQFVLGGNLVVENAIGSRFADSFVAGAAGTIHGMDGNDRLYAAESQSHLFGDQGDDLVLMYSRFGEANGGDGDDVIEFAFFDAGARIISPASIDGGDGNDTARFTDYWRGHVYNSITFELGRNGAEGSYTLSDGTTGVLHSIENIDQSLHQSPDPNTAGIKAAIYGNEEANVLVGSGMDDIIAANGRGAPRSNGDTTVDVMTGAESGDTFLITNVTAKHGTVIATDEITDFTHSDGDKIDLSQVDAKPGTATIDHFKFIGNDAFGGHAGELRFEIADGVTMVMADTNGDTVADFAIQLDGEMTLRVVDLVL